MQNSLSLFLLLLHFTGKQHSSTFLSMFSAHVFKRPFTITIIKCCSLTKQDTYSSYNLQIDFFLWSNNRLYSSKPLIKYRNWFFTVIRMCYTLWPFCSRLYRRSLWASASSSTWLWPPRWNQWGVKARDYMCCFCSSHEWKVITLFTQYHSLLDMTLKYQAEIWKWAVLLTQFTSSGSYLYKSKFRVIEMMMKLNSC